MKCAHIAPAMPQMNAEITNAIHLVLMTSIPTALAACTLSREARNFMPRLLSLNTNATTMMTNAQIAAVHMSVYFSNPNRVRGPLVIAVHCDSTTCTITSNAKEAIAAAVSANRISGKPTIAANTAATAAAANTAGRNPSCRFWNGVYRSGSDMSFWSGGKENSAEAYAPMPMNPTCAKDNSPELPMKICNPNTMITFTNITVVMRSTSEEPNREATIATMRKMPRVRATGITLRGARPDGSFISRSFPWRNDP